MGVSPKYRSYFLMRREMLHSSMPNQHKGGGFHSLRSTSSARLSNNKLDAAGVVVDGFRENVRLVHRVDATTVAAREENPMTASPHVGNDTMASPQAGTWDLGPSWSRACK